MSIRRGINLLFTLQMTKQRLLEVYELDEFSLPLNGTANIKKYAFIPDLVLF